MALESQSPESRGRWYLQSSFGTPMPIQIKQPQIDELVVADTDGLAAELADSLFGAHGCYAPMPAEVRRRLARVAIAEARANGIDTLTAIVPFVQRMVEMNPRFPSYPPLRAILTLPDRRPAVIARRWVRGYAPALFVRPWLAFALADEVRLVFRQGRPWRALVRHSADHRTVALARWSALAAAVDLAALGALLPPDGQWSLDFAPSRNRWWLLDYNPWSGAR